MLEKTKVNLSSSFVVRSRCKYCHSGPAHYYFSKNPNLLFSPNWKYFESAAWLSKCYKRICSDYYLMDSPSYVKSVSDFTHKVRYKAFRPKLFKNKGVHPFSDYREFLICECGKSCWEFYQKSTSKRVEIINRKSRYNHKFIFNY